MGSPLPLHHLAKLCAEPLPGLLPTSAHVPEVMPVPLSEHPSTAAQCTAKGLVLCFAKAPTTPHPNSLICLCPSGPGAPAGAAPRLWHSCLRLRVATRVADALGKHLWREEGRIRAPFPVFRLLSSAWEAASTCAPCTRPGTCPGACSPRPWERGPTVVLATGPGGPHVLLFTPRPVPGVGAELSLPGEGLARLSPRSPRSLQKAAGPALPDQGHPGVSLRDRPVSGVLQRLWNIGPPSSLHTNDHLESLTENSKTKTKGHGLDHQPQVQKAVFPGTHAA